MQLRHRRKCWYLDQACMLARSILVDTTHSSRMTRVRGVRVRRMSLVSDSSTMKVDLPLPISSDAPMRLDISSYHCCNSGSSYV